MPSQQTYQRLVSVVRQLDRRDSLYVIWAYTQLLQQSGFRLPNDIEVSRALLDARPMQSIIGEWSLEILAREVLKHAGEQARRGRTLRRWATIAEAMNLLRALERELYDEFNRPELIHLELMRISHQQFAWQRDAWNEQFFVRYHKIFNTPAIDAICTQQTGLSVQAALLIGVLYIGHFIDSFVCDVTPEIEIPGLTQADIDLFLRITCNGQREIARRLRDDHALDETFKYKYSAIRQFPLVRTSFNGRDQVICPQPTLLFWRFTQGLYYSLQHVAGFPTAFGSSFQTYVGDVLGVRIRGERLSVIPEAEYFVGRNRKDTVDWIVCEGDSAALFVECKTMRLTWNSKAGLTDLAALAQDVRKLAGAVVQLYKAVLDYQADRYPNLPFSRQREIYPIVVTLEDWLLFGQDLPRRLAAEVRTKLLAAEMDADLVDRMPVTIMSVDELETAIGVVNAAGIRAVMAEKVADRGFQSWSMGTYLMDRFPDERRALGPPFPGGFAAAFPGASEL